MIPRSLKEQLEKRIQTFPAVALLGPRQVGKTTLALLTAAERPHVHLDLERPSDLARLSDARAYLSTKNDRLVVLDEVQRAPQLFEVLRGIIDERIRRGSPVGHFLLLGSASMDLLQQSSESLAGRIAYLELSPFTVREVGQDRQTRIWSRGGFPMSFLAESDQDSAIWRENFIRTYLERDIPMLGPRVPSETLRRFWTMLAHGQGSLLNAANLARALAVDGKTIARYLDLMVDLLLVRRLPPFHANVRKRLVKAPKVYVRDSGIVHTLLRLDDEDSLLGHPVAGMSWECFVLETLLGSAPERTQASFYRTATGVEIDLVLLLPGDRMWVVEIKRSQAPKVDKGFRVALTDLKPDRAFVVYSGEERYPIGDGVEVVGLVELAEELARLNA